MAVKMKGMKKPAKAAVGKPSSKPVGGLPTKPPAALGPLNMGIPAPGAGTAFKKGGMVKRKSNGRGR